MVAHNYVEETTLSGHLTTIMTIAFSPDTRYLASASEDGVILVFSTNSWKPIGHFVNVSPVSALIWHPTFLNTIICGLKNGDVLTFCFEHGDQVCPSSECLATMSLIHPVEYDPQESVDRRPWRPG